MSQQLTLAGFEPPFLDEFRRHHPRANLSEGFPDGCPDYYGYEADSDPQCGGNCRECWRRWIEL